MEGATVEPNCEHEGSVTYVCTNGCGEEKVEKLEKLQHEMVPGAEVEANCKNPGYKLEICRLCGHEEKTEYPINPDNHNWVVGATVEANCEHGGSVTYVCTNGCGQEKVETSPALGHTVVTVPAKAPTCTEGGYEAYEQCSVCGKLMSEVEMLMPTGHQHLLMGYNDANHWAYCNDCGTVLSSDRHELVYWTKDGYKHVECKHCDYEQVTKIPAQKGELDGLPKCGDR